MSRLLRVPITVDFFKESETTAKINEGSSGAYLDITINNNGKEYDLTDKTVRVFMRLINKTVSFKDCILEKDSDDKLHCILELDTNILAVKGIVAGTCIVTASDGDSLRTNTFRIQVGETIYDKDAIESSNEFSALDNILKSIDNGNYNIDVKEAVNKYITDNGLSATAESITLKDGTNVETTVSQLKEDLVDKVNKSEIANGLIANGACLYADLPLENNTIGDYWYCNDGDGTNGAGNYVWNGEAWYYGGNGNTVNAKVITLEDGTTIEDTINTIKENVNKISTTSTATSDEIKTMVDSLYEEGEE